MSKLFAIAVLSMTLVAVVAASICRPSILDDSNSFLRGFVNHELLNVLGVILAITLASAAQIHLKFNEMEEHKGRRFLIKSRVEVKHSVVALIASFSVAVLLVFAKPYFVGNSSWESIINGMAMLVLLFNILLLVEITSAVFRIPPNVE